MLFDDLVGFGLFVGYFMVAGIVPLLMVRGLCKAPFELARKMLHIVITMSIFPLLYLFSAWYVAIVAALGFTLGMYVILGLVADSWSFQRLAVEREDGEFRRSLIVVQLSIITLVSVFRGLLGIDWQYIAVVALMAWGFGDAAAALIGRAFGTRTIVHPQVQGPKTVEGTLAMFVVAGLSIFLTLATYASHPWHVSLAVALLVAPVSSAVEFFSPRGKDTITVPLSTAFAILPLISLFSFLGV